MTTLRRVISLRCWSRKLLPLEGALALLQRNRLRSGGRAEGTHIIPGVVHVDLYDQMDKIPFDKLVAFFQKNLAASA